MFDRRQHFDSLVAAGVPKFIAFTQTQQAEKEFLQRMQQEQAQNQGTYGQAGKLAGKALGAYGAKQAKDLLGLGKDASSAASSLGSSASTIPRISEGSILAETPSFGVGSYQSPSVLEASKAGTNITGSAPGIGGKIIPGLETAAGAYALYDAIEDGDTSGAGMLQSGLGGLGLAHGLGSLGLYAPLGIGGLLAATVGAALLPHVTKSLGIGQKSTEDYQKERWGKLSPALRGLQQANHPDNDSGVYTEITDPTGRHTGKKWTFDISKDIAMERPETFVGVLGNLETFGDEWLGVDRDKQNQIVQELLKENLYSSDKGDVLISGKKGHQNRAKEIFDRIMGKTTTTPQKTSSLKVPLGQTAIQGVKPDPNSSAMTAWNSLSPEEKQKILSTVK